MLEFVVASKESGEAGNPYKTCEYQSGRYEYFLALNEDQETILCHGRTI
jgi:hypothetical protein